MGGCCRALAPGGTGTGQKRTRLSGSPEHRGQGPGVLAARAPEDKGGVGALPTAGAGERGPGDAWIPEQRCGPQIWDLSVRRVHTAWPGTAIPCGGRGCLTPEALQVCWGVFCPPGGGRRSLEGEAAT